MRDRHLPISQEGVFFACLQGMKTNLFSMHIIYYDK